MMIVLVSILMAAGDASGSTLVPEGHPLRSAPALEPVIEDLPIAELVATPEVRTLLGYTRRPLHLPDGHTMALFTLSFSGEANWIFLIDGRDGSWQRLDMPDNDVGSHGAALGADGKLYIHAYGPPRVHCFDPDTGAFETLPVHLPEGEWPWDALGASNGRIYFGSYPNAYLAEYDPATGTWEEHRQVVPNTKYTSDFSEDAQGRIVFKAWGPDEAWVRFDPASRDLEHIDEPIPPAKATFGEMPAAPHGDKSFRNPVCVGDRWFAVSNPSGRLWELLPDTAPRLLGETGAPAEPTWWFKVVGQRLTGVSYFGGVFHYDLDTDAFTTSHLNNLAPGGNTIMFLETVAPDCVVGANYSQQNLFALNPQTGQVRIPDTMIAKVGGEPMCAVGFGGKAYLGIHINAIISIYDPTKPFAFDENPRELIDLSQHYPLVRGRAAVADAQHVYISFDSAYNHLGGALVVIDPKIEAVDVYHHLIKDQNLPTPALDPSTGLLWGGTDRWGQMRSHPPTQERALIYAFDSERREVVAQLTPWPKADMIDALGVAKNGVLVATNENELALIDTRTRELLYQGALPFAKPSLLRLGRDGNMYCLVEGAFCRWDFESNRLYPLARAEKARYLTETSAGRWLVADDCSVYRLSVK